MFDLRPSWPNSLWIALLFVFFASSVAHGAEGNLAALVGSWIRPDGGYQLKVLSIEEDGAARVEYFNPSPVHVAEAKAEDKDGTVSLYVRLEDEGYPGSKYRLVLQDNRLVGDYFQATAGQTHQIFFDRAP